MEELEAADLDLLLWMLSYPERSRGRPDMTSQHGVRSCTAPACMELGKLDELHP